MTRGFQWAFAVMISAGCEPRPVPAAGAKVQVAAPVLDSSLLALPDMAERVVLSVVSVSTMTPIDPNDPSMQRYLRVPQHNPRESEGQGSGVIIRADGVVVTNHHVVEGAKTVKVSLSDGRVLDAAVVGSDPKTDVAVLRLVDPPDDLAPITFGDSDALRLGEIVLAVGNPFGVGQTLTMGIVSALGRSKVGLVDYEDYIQTDAAINPGNSGGALVDLKGNLVGINSAIFSKSGGSQGIGFAIPARLVRQLSDMILEHGHVDRGFLGVGLQDVASDLRSALGLGSTAGVLVADVQPDSPAARAGLLAGDVVTHYDGKPVPDAARLRTQVATSGANHAFTMVVLRDKERLELTGTLGTLPGESRNGIPSDRYEVTGELKLDPLTPERRKEHSVPDRLDGVWIAAVASGGRFERAGVRPQDLVLDINRVPVTSPQAFHEVYDKAKDGKILLRVYRDGEIRFIAV